jgi:hypothetical protein
VTFEQAIPPVYPSLQENATFDLRTSITDKIGSSFMSAKDVDAIRELFGSPMRVAFGRFKQTDSTGDFHIIALIHQFKWVKPSQGGSGLAVSIALHTRVYDKFGTLLYDAGQTYPELLIPDNGRWGPVTAKTRTLVATQEAISQALEPFAGKIYGYKTSLNSRLAYLDDVKKKPELKSFETQVDEIRKVLNRQGIANFISASTPYVPFWEKMTAYNGEGEVNEVKRAALQNLALYAILTGDFDKAVGYVEAYKPIDKTEKALFGLASHRNSDDLEQLLIKLQGKPEEDIRPVSDRVLTASEVVKLNNFLTIDGTIVVEGKHAGTYKGAIQVRRPEPQPTTDRETGGGGGLGGGLSRLGGGGGGGNMLNLGAEELMLTVPVTDAAGVTKPTLIRSSVVKSLKGADGTDYQFRKFGTGGLAGGSVWYLLRSDYQSPKITVYRSSLPTTSEYVLLKPGDDKGVKSSLLNARRNALDYLKECATLSDKYQKTNAPFDIKQVAVDYTNCQ